MTAANTEARRSPRALILAAIAALALVVATLFVAYNQPQPAQASSLTYVHNGTMSNYMPIYVVRDNGVRVSLNRQQGLWGVQAVAVQSGTCVRINGGGEICHWAGGFRNVGLGTGQYNVARTR